MIILGVDPGFASFGYALVRLVVGGEEVVSLGTLCTEKLQTKQKVLASDDNVRRAQELATGIRGLVRDGASLCAICAESMSFPRNSSSSAKVGISWGVIAAMSQAWAVPVVQASPQRIKKTLCGRANASKEEVEIVLRRRYPEAGSLLDGIEKSLREHASDALASVVACLDSESLRLARKMVYLEADRQA